MIELASIKVRPEIRLFGVAGAGLDALCEELGFDEERRFRLRLGAEEVFLYCLRAIRKSGASSPVTVRFFSAADAFMIILEYKGGRGEMDQYLKPGKLSQLKVKTFEALGLCLAGNILDGLRSDYSASENRNRYILTYNCPRCRAPEETGVCESED